MTKSKNSINYPPLFASAKYYSKEDFQFPVTAVTVTEIQQGDAAVLL